MATTSDEDFKRQGNMYFHNKQFPQAIECYTNAIKKNASVPTYYNNRALCYLKLKKYDNVASDSRRAIEIDASCVKGYYFLGQALYEQGKYDEAVNALKKAFQLARQQKFNVGDDITNILRMAKRKRWNELEQKRIRAQSDLYAYLKKLMFDDKERKIKNCKSDDSAAVADVNMMYDSYSDQLENIFRKVDEKHQKREVPDYLCGKISFDLMKDPVITPSGITYDRKDIEEHLLRVGHFDPVTRSELVPSQLISNLSMKDVLEAFITENPWVEGSDW
ncbi:STIP1 homology and U box-containing protein 1 [Trichoplax sp. H2]|nr:STIP1 homology and U box-containing protein 1 [Trichoplax sp. H2]|eukprot:RDD42571.1 STIP1 homology and U box-containing protein 1 [Trichoplax sp. H2]